jgi:2-polyprenyl-3-methyl-5-hydroxy-6-metoxy-1,4-benzoquinol methylase
MGWWSRQTRALDASNKLCLDFPACINREFPHVFPAAWTATERVIELLPDGELTPLERRSPGLRGYDWRRYLRCSAARVVRAIDALVAAVSPGGRVLDAGAYFGNFALAAAERGYAVDALDAYRAYEDALMPWVRLLRGAGVQVLDFDAIGFDLAGVVDATYDAVLLMGVVEHVPHSPRALLRAVRRVLKPGGLLVLDTPNIAYAYNRDRLARGESIMAPLESQFDCEPPFEGHHREYTMAEVRWMLERVGFGQVSVDAFNYSVYGLDCLVGGDLRLHREMQEDPTRREVVFATGRRPGD